VKGADSVKNTRPTESICWDCANARANLCPWIAKKKRIWARALKEERSAGDGSGKYIPVYIIQTCRHYRPDAKRKVVAW